MKYWLQVGLVLLTFFAHSQMGVAQTSDAVTRNATQVSETDSIAKSILPLYSMARLQEGLYRSFETFLQQKPDTQIDTTQQKGALRIWDAEKERFRYFLPKEIKQYYGLVRAGRPYIFIRTGAQELERFGMEWGFIGNVEEHPNYGAVAAAQGGAIGGLVGSLVSSAADPNKGFFRYTLDYRNGKFVKGESVKKEKRK